MKKILLLILAGLSVGCIRADLAGLFKKAKEVVTEAAPIVGKAKVYPTDTKISFEVKNKSNKIVHVAIKSDGTFVEERGSAVFSVHAGTTKGLTVDINKKTEISVWRTAQPGSASETAEMTYSVPTGKTLYFTWDGSILRPQTGPAGGKLGKTDTGMSIKNNVSKTDVKQV